MRRLLFLFFVALCSCSISKVTPMDEMTENKRIKLLNQISKDAILKYGKEFYRKGKPIIELFKVLEGENKGRKAYKMTYPYDKNIEKMELGYAAKVWIWSDTNKPYLIMFGNNMGFQIEKIEKGK